MEIDLKNILQYIGYGISAFLVALFAPITAKYKNKIKSKISEMNDKVSTAIDTTKTQISINNDYIKTLVETAEKYTSYTASQKLDYVLTKYRIYCVDNNIEYDENTLTTEIESLIKLSKVVNFKK